MEKLGAKLPAHQAEMPKRSIAVQLTPREKEVLRLIGFGATNREIAETLFIWEGTVKTHVNHLLSRLTLRTRSQLAIYAHSIFHAAN